MYPILHQLLSDKKGGVVFACFGSWHLAYMAAAFAVIAALLFCLRRKDEAARKKAVNCAVCFAFGLYIADFFLMPFAYGAIDLEKLPFHACTATCVLCFLTRKDGRWDAYRLPLTALALASNLIYLVYPAGVGWQQIHPLCYRTFQTLLFHAAMTAYGVLALAYGKQRPAWRDLRRALPLIGGMTLWAMLGNCLYNGTADGYDHFFNWFFVVQDPFYLLPAHIAPYLMPFVMVLVMLTAVALVYGGYFTIRKLIKK